MKNADKTGSKVFRLIHFGKHAKDYIPDRGKQKTEPCTVLKEVDTEFFRDGKDTMSVYAGNELAGHMKRTELIVFVTTGRTEAAFTAEGNKLEITTVGAAIHGTTMRRVAAMNHLVNIFDDGRTGVQFINDMFVIVGKNGL